MGALLDNRAFEAAAKQSPKSARIYIVKRGDTLSQIISRHYQVKPFSPTYKTAEQSVILFNQHIQHADKIYPGDKLRLMPLPSAGPVPLNNGLQPRKPIIQSPLPPPVYQHKFEPMANHRTAIIRDKIPDDRHQQAAFELLVALENNHGVISAGLSGAANAFGNLVGHGKSELILEITEIYEDFKAGKMTRNQYNYRRQKVVNTLKRRMGPIFMRESLHIDRRKAFSPTWKIERHADRIAKLSRLATTSGILLAGVGAGLSCRDIAKTDDRQEKNEIFVESVVGLLAGYTTSFALNVVLASNPVGWGLAVVLGVGAAATAWGSGLGAKKLYDFYFNELDLVKLSRVDQLCK